MQRALLFRFLLPGLAVSYLAVFQAQSFAADAAALLAESTLGTPPDMEILPAEEWDKIDKSVDLALLWLSGQQQKDGSMPTFIGGQPGVSALAGLAFLSKGHQPGEGNYGETINRLIDYVMARQRDEGMFLLDATTMPVTMWERGAHTGLYNHAIASLFLCECYGMANATRQEELRQAITKALEFARQMQEREQPFEDDQGGFRYYKKLNQYAGKGDSDLSVTGWFVLFYRSAKNAGFDVPQDYIREAVDYVERCYDSQEHAFYYGLHGHDRTSVGRAMTGAGLMCLTSLGDQHEKIAREAGRWILDHPFGIYGEQIGWYDRFHYGGYYCSQAMLQLGGEYWAQFFPPLAKTLLENQTKEGFWPPERAHGDGKFGSAYTTAISVLTLTAPYQLLPIHQH